MSPNTNPINTLDMSFGNILFAFSFNLLDKFMLLYSIYSIGFSILFAIFFMLFDFKFPTMLFVFRYNL